MGRFSGGPTLVSAMPVMPNILWMVTTQWRAGALGYAGDPNARTPHLDALAGESVNYAQAVTPHPFGPLARAAMLTGVLSPENGIRDYFDPLPVTAQTIAHELADRGYATAFFGKWHLGKRDPAAALVGQAHAKIMIPREGRAGFEFWEGFESGFLLNDPLLHGSRLPAPVLVKGYQSDVLCERARDWLADPHNRKAASWFCVVSLEAPHPPYDAPAAHSPAAGSFSGPGTSRRPRGGAGETRARQELAGYYAHLEATDRAIGRLLEGVRREDTIVVFTSVHGDMHGAHGLFRKGWPYEESVRVPLLVRRPGGRARRDESAVSLVDLSRMTRDWAQGGEGGGAGPAPAYARISMPSVVALPFQCDRAWRGVRTPTRKFILNADGTPWLFFDLEQDPLEQTNLAGEAARWEEMAALIALIGR
jgi:arylsulfatase A-like enzyme